MLRKLVYKQILHAGLFLWDAQHTSGAMQRALSTVCLGIECPLCSPPAGDVPRAGAGLRIFRLVRAKRQLEQKQVAEQAVLPPKEANVILYTLLKGGFVCLAPGQGCASSAW